MNEALKPKYPDVTVQLSKEDGHAFNVINSVQRALRDQAGVSKDELELFFNEATQGSYDDLIQTCMKWVTVA